MESLQHTVEFWTPQEVASWLEITGLERYSEAFIDSHITGASLLGITPEDLRFLGITNLRHRAQILSAVADLKGMDISPVVPKDPGSLSASFGHQRSPSNASARSANGTSSYGSLERPVLADIRNAAGNTTSTSGAALIPPRTKSHAAFPDGWDASHGVTVSKAIVSEKEKETITLPFKPVDRNAPLPQTLRVNTAFTPSPPLSIPTPQVVFPSHPNLPPRDDSLLDFNSPLSPSDPPDTDYASETVRSPFTQSASDVSSPPVYVQDMPSPPLTVQDVPLSPVNPRDGLSRFRSNSSGILRRHPAIRDHRGRSPAPSVPSDKSQGPVRRPHLSIGTNFASLSSASSPLVPSPGTDGSAETLYSNDSRFGAEDSGISSPRSEGRSENFHFNSFASASSFQSPNIYEGGDRFESYLEDTVAAMEGKSSLTPSDRRDTDRGLTPVELKSFVFEQFNAPFSPVMGSFPHASGSPGEEPEKEGALGEDGFTNNVDWNVGYIEKKVDIRLAPAADITATNGEIFDGAISQLSSDPTVVTPSSTAAVPMPSLQRDGHYEELGHHNRSDSDAQEGSDREEFGNPLPIFKSSSTIPPLGPEDQDGFGSDWEVASVESEPAASRFSDREEDGEEEEGPPEFLVAQYAMQGMDPFFGERPPTEAICDHLENFFPALSSETPAGVSNVRRGSLAQTLKHTVRETLNRKKLERVGTTSSSFGRRPTTVRVTTRKETLVASSVATDSVFAESESIATKESASPHNVVTENGNITRQWEDRIADIPEEISVVTGKNADWVPVSTPLPRSPTTRSSMFGVSDGEGDTLDRPMASRRRSEKRLLGKPGVRRQSMDVALETLSLQRPGKPMARVWTTRREALSLPHRSALSISRKFSNERNAVATTVGEAESSMRRVKSQENMEFTKPGELMKSMYAKKYGLATLGRSDGGRRGSLPLISEDPLARLQSKRRASIAVAHEPLKSNVEPSERPVDPSAMATEDNVVGPIEVSEDASHLAQPVDLPAAPQPEQPEELPVVDASPLPTAPMPSVAEAAESEDAPSSHIATLPRAFTIEPDTPRRVEWMCGPLIGKGSFAKVYYGIKVDTGDIMAVKQVEMINIPRKKAGGKKDARRRMVDALHQEITLLKDLDHENVVRYLGYDVQGKHINVFLEYVSGGSIASAIATMGRFEEPLVRSLTCQILCGLQYLHERAIIHRDIKGGNVLLDESGVAKITDFGISKKNEYKLAYRMNTKMSLQGSVHWMAPEVVKAKGYSAKVDIWSLGCLVLEMFTGYNPWRQLDELQTVWKLGRENAPPIPEWLSPMAQEFLAKCFTIDPDQRPTAAQLLDHSFADVDPADLDFRAYKEAAIAQKRLEEEAESSYDSEDYESDELDDVRYAGGAGPRLTSRVSMRTNTVRSSASRRMFSVKRNSTKRSVFVEVQTQAQTNNVEQAPTPQAEAASQRKTSPEPSTTTTTTTAKPINIPSKPSPLTMNQTSAGHKSPNPSSSPMSPHLLSSSPQSPISSSPKKGSVPKLLARAGISMMS